MGKAACVGQWVGWQAQQLTLCLLCVHACAAGKLRDVADWAGEVPDAELAVQVLRRSLPVLHDMRKRALEEVGAIAALACLGVFHSRVGAG